jgi:hypothetical protein
LTLLVAARYATTMRIAALAILVSIFVPSSSFSFSVLAHQGVVDTTWESSIVPDLRRRFPHAGSDDLEKARAFAYGGSHIADLGYFPLGNRVFTDLLHYVRTGDFVEALLASATTIDEYAFALGVAAHYVTDTIGHPEATNRAIAEIYPALRKKYGDSVTYAQDHSAHLMTEFRFDVLEMSRNKRSRDLFQHALQFQVAERVLNEAFEKTYGLRLDDLFANTDVAILTYRFTFRTLIEEATGIAWELYRADIGHLDPAATSESFVYELSRADFEKEFGKAYRQPGYFARFLAFVVKLVPNKGPFKRMVYVPLPPHVRQLFTTALEHATTRYRSLIAPAHRPNLTNVNLDTGRPTRRGEYEPADDAYAQLLEKLDERRFATMSPALRADLLHFFHAEPHVGGKRGGDSAALPRKVRDALAHLEQSSPSPG